MEKEVQVFKYQQPEFEGVKKSIQLCKSDILRGLVQVVKKGGENNLHAHTGDDAFWLVLSGMVKFYGEGDKLLAELKKHEGIMIPRGYMYWFESASEEPLEILRVSARDQNTENKRVNYTPLKDWQLERHIDRA